MFFDMIAELTANSGKVELIWIWYEDEAEMLPPSSRDVVTAPRRVKRTLFHPGNVGIAERLHQELQKWWKAKQDHASCWKEYKKGGKSQSSHLDYTNEGRNWGSCIPIDNLKVPQEEQQGEEQETQISPQREEEGVCMAASGMEVRHLLWWSSIWMGRLLSMLVAWSSVVSRDTFDQSKRWRQHHGVGSQRRRRWQVNYWMNRWRLRTTSICSGGLLWRLKVRQSSGQLIRRV